MFVYKPELLFIVGGSIQLLLDPDDIVDVVRNVTCFKALHSIEVYDVIDA